MYNFTYTNINEKKLWIENVINMFNSKKTIHVDNYNDFFKQIKKILSFGDFHDKYNALLVSDKILQHYFLNQTTEYDFINAFNTIIEELISFIGENNVFNNVAEKVFGRYIKHHDNIEFLLKFIITHGLGNHDWKIRHNSLILLSMIIEQKYLFIVEKKNFTVKIIESLIFHTKDKASKIGILSAQLLTEFISKLPNYREINLLLSVDSISEIEKIVSNERTNSLNVIKQSISLFKNNLSQKSLNIQSEQLKQISDNYGLENDYKDYPDSSKQTKMNLFEFFSKIKGKTEFNGVLFGVFPKNLIESTDTDVSFEIRSQCFERIKTIFYENFNQESFIPFCPAFFNFISNFLNDQYNNISLICLEMISKTLINFLDKIIGKVSGIDLLVNLLNLIPKLAESFSKLNASITFQTIEAFKLLMMVIQTSKLIPHLLKFLGHPNWVVISNVLDILFTIFDSLPSINNDIDFDYDKYDINLFLPILSVLRHPVPKVYKTFIIGSIYCKEDSYCFN